MNLPAGALLLVVPWPLAFGPEAMLNSLVAGLALVSLGFVRGPVRERFDGGWAVLWRGTSTGERERGR